ncbi:MAG TPA: GTPase [Desulfurococcaceae archaeon]|nr:GTPase [Desulfurococcaceae archaeon]
MPRMIVVLMGPAGSGKTTLTAALGKWIEENQGHSVGYINLDPGAETLPYNPDFDVREWFTIEDIMVKEGLGPNGAMIRASELLVEKSRELRKILHSIEKEVLIVDTPGQSEIFIFRPAGPAITRLLRWVATTIGIYLVDPTITPILSEATTSLLMGLIVQLRLNIPVVPAVTKADLVRLELGETLVIGLEKVRELASKELQGALKEVIPRLIDLMVEYMPSVRLVKVSAKTGEGLEELYQLIYETYCSCGDLT